MLSSETPSPRVQCFAGMPEFAFRFIASKLASTVDCVDHRIFDRHQPSMGASLLAMRPALIASSPKLYPVQSLVRQQRPQFNYLRHAQQHVPPRAFKIESKVAEHRVGRDQGFTEVG